MRPSSSRVPTADRGSPGPYADALHSYKPITFGSSTASTSRMPVAVRPDTSTAGHRKGQRRPIVVDGCNVGYQYGRNDQFHAKGLQIVYEYFSNKGAYFRRWSLRITFVLSVHMYYIIHWSLDDLRRTISLVQRISLQNLLFCRLEQQGDCHISQTALYGRRKSRHLRPFV